MSYDDGYDEVQIKCVVIGDPGSGKTSLRRKFVGESFDTNYLQTIGSDFSYQMVEIDDKNIGLAIWDLAGQPQFKSVHSLFYKGAAAIIVAYDVSNRESFENISNWLDDFVEQTGINDLPVLIIGNKIDLIERGMKTTSEGDQVELIKNLNTKNEWNFIYSSIRTSAKTGENVNEGILAFASKIVSWINTHNRDHKDKQVEFSDDPVENFPFFYQIAMNQISGPIIIASLPKITEKDYPLHKEVITKLLASFNFEDVTTNLSITGKLEILEFDSPMIYNAFNIENEDARGSSELYITAFTVTRELKNVIVTLKSVIDGFLHNSMNRFQKIRIEKNLDYITKPFDQSKNIHEEDVIEVLMNLRDKIQENAKNWLVNPSSSKL